MAKKVDYLWSLSEMGYFVLRQGELVIQEAYAFASDVQGRMIDTRTAKLVSVKEENGVETRNLVPLIMKAGTGGIPDIWKSIWTKILLVPYDNDMWLRYEAVPLRAGRRSYDLSVMFSEETKEVLLSGAMKRWK